MKLPKAASGRYKAATEDGNPIARLLWIPHQVAEKIKRLLDAGRCPAFC